MTDFERLCDRRHLSSHFGLALWLGLKGVKLAPLVTNDYKLGEVGHSAVSASQVREV